MERDTQPSATTWARVAGSVTGAFTLMVKIWDRLPDSALVAKEAVMEAAGSLELILSELHETGRHEGLSPGSGWALDQRWHSAVFSVASSRPRVLLTVGANALRDLADIYGLALDEEWDPEEEKVLMSHKSWVVAAEGEFIDIRQQSVPAAS